MAESIAKTNWSEDENRATIESYFALFLADVRGEPINKAAAYRSLEKRFGRSWKAYEYKAQNISAVLVRSEWPHLRGLLPRFNYQAVLEVLVAEHILGRERSDFQGLEHPKPSDENMGPVDLVFRSAPELSGGRLQHAGIFQVKRYQGELGSR